MKWFYNMDEIVPSKNNKGGIFVGGCESANNIEQIKNNKIKAVLNCA